MFVIQHVQKKLNRSMNRITRKRKLKQDRQKAKVLSVTYDNNTYTVTYKAKPNGEKVTIDCDNLTKQVGYNVYLHKDLLIK